VAYLLFDAINGFCNKSSRSPVLFASADIRYKVLEQLASVHAMGYFRVKLNGINRIFRKMLPGFISSHRNAFRPGNDFKILRKFLNSVSMAHPYLRTFRNRCKQRVFFQNLQMSASILPVCGFSYLPTRQRSNELSAITNTQYRQ